jgi:DNA sulfur modification protein DndB
MALPFEYAFPAIRGIQAGREFYVSMCPARLIPKLFSFDDEEIPAEMRAQRTLNKARVPEIARYILSNPSGYIFSAITVSINAEINFESIGNTDVGQLKVPMDARFVINDGQHRRAAFELALKENPDIGNETIAVVFFLDIGLKRSQQMFTDLNRHATRPDPSLSILYDHRDTKSILAKSVIKQVKAFERLTDTERSNLPTRSSKLFTLSGIYSATLALLKDFRDESMEKQIAIAVEFWDAVSAKMPEWSQVLERKVSAGEIRKDYVHAYAVTLAGLGSFGAVLISMYPDNWRKKLDHLLTIDWSRSNPEWEGRIMFGGKISKSRASISSILKYLKVHFDLPLSAEEEREEKNLRRNNG